MSSKSEKGSKKSSSSKESKREKSKGKSSKSEKVSKVVEPEPQQEPEVPEELPVVDEEPKQEPSFEDEIKNLKETVSGLFKVLKTVESKLKTISSLHQQLKKNKKGEKKKRNSNVQPSGINKIVRVPDILTEFLGLETGFEATRPQVTKLMYNYIKTKDLQNPDNGTFIHVENDRPLLELFGPAVHPIKKKKPELGLGYSTYNLQSYLAPLYKTEQTV